MGEQTVKKASPDGGLVAGEGRRLAVIGAGLGRTGTLSLKLALEKLGFGPCYHMTELMERPEDLPTWEAAARGERARWDDVFGRFGATVDWPGCAFYEDLARAYPDAKVLLTVRDPFRWYESARHTIYDMRHRTLSASPLLAGLGFVFGLLDPSSARQARLVRDLVWEGTFGGRFEDRDHAISVFEEHAEEVKRKVPEERLLVFDVREGWEPLCRFLGVEVPEGEPFPHVNERGGFRRMVYGRVWGITRSRLAISTLAALAAAPVLGVAAALWRARQGR